MDQSNELGQVRFEEVIQTNSIIYLIGQPIGCPFLCAIARPLGLFCIN